MDKQNSLKKGWRNKRTYWTNNIALKKAGTTSGGGKNRGGPNWDEIWPIWDKTTWRVRTEKDAESRIRRTRKFDGVRFRGSNQSERSLGCKTTKQGMRIPPRSGTRRFGAVRASKFGSIGRYGYASKHRLWKTAWKVRNRAIYHHTNHLSLEKGLQKL